MPALILQSQNQRTSLPTFLDHLNELRSRLFWSAASFGIGATIGYFINTPFVALLLKPLHQSLYYTSPTGGFDFVFKTSVFFGFIFAFPTVVYHILKFIEPLLPKSSQALIIKLLLSSCLLSVTGILFAYLISLPAALNFLGQFGSGQVKSLISAPEYFSFVTTYIAGFAILFQLPLILLFINKIKPLKPGQLMRKQRYVILASFIIAAVLTPTPDILNQTIMALPMIALYLLSIGLIWFGNYLATRKQAKAIEASFPSRSRLRKKRHLFKRANAKLKFSTLTNQSYA